MPIHAMPFTRRRFLAGSAALLAGGQIGSACRGAEPAVGKWAMLADVHLLDANIIPKLPANLRKDRSEKVTLVRERLTQVVDEVVSLASRPAGMILNGDCVEVGTPTEYGLMLERFDKLMQKGIPVHFTLGNHDHRANFSGSRLQHASLTEDRCVSVIETEHANWVLLDSLVMKTDESKGTQPWSHIQESGQLGRQQLKWLAATLQKHADKPALVVVHHNAIPGKQFFDRIGQKVTEVLRPAGERRQGKGIEDGDDFLKVLFAHKQVKAAFCGHQHQLQIRNWNGIHFVYQPAVGYPFNPKDAVGWLECDLAADGMKVSVHTPDRQHSHSGHVVDLKWA